MLQDYYDWRMTREISNLLQLMNQKLERVSPLIDVVG